MNKMVRHRLGIDKKRLTASFTGSLEAKEYFKKKVLEEAQEVFDAKTEKELHEELGDLIQIIKEFLDTPHVNKERVNLGRKLKNLEKGKFVSDDKIIILDKE